MDKGEWKSIQGWVTFGDGKVASENQRRQQAILCTISNK